MKPQTVEKHECNNEMSLVAFNRDILKHSFQFTACAILEVMEPQNPNQSMVGQAEWSRGGEKKIETTTAGCDQLRYPLIKQTQTPNQH